MAAPIIRDGIEYSIADQVARFANAKATDNKRYLDITTVYDPSGLKDKRILVTGASKGLGLELVKEISAQGGIAIGTVRSSTPELDELVGQGKVKVIGGIELQKDECMPTLVKELAEPVDIVINNAGYFYGPSEKVGTAGADDGHMNFEENLKQIDICGLAPLRVSYALYKANLIKPDGKIIIISSQAGSLEWRLTQNQPGGGMDYGHHMSRAACNMGGVLLAQDLKPHNIPVQMLHPGFNRTTMTSKYAHIWDVEGAVEPSVGAKRVLYETLKADMTTTGTMINCEDGLRIPN